MYGKVLGIGSYPAILLLLVAIRQVFDVRALKGDRACSGDGFHGQLSRDALSCRNGHDSRSDGGPGNKGPVRKLRRERRGGVAMGSGVAVNVRLMRCLSQPEKVAAKLV